MSKLKDLQTRGQSIWLDYIQRSLMVSGELERLIGDGLRGLTSNPSIFEKSIVESTEYQADLARLAQGTLSTKEAYEQLAITDIQLAADAFRVVYDESGGRDGLVSLEVSPELARDTKGTLSEARRLWKKVNRRNLMIKVPGTPEGLAAIEVLIGDGVNVNVTLLFSVSVYEKVAASYIAGLTRRASSGNTIDRIASVASFFVSRVDSAVDTLLEALLKTATVEQRSMLEGLRGKAAIANAKLAYERYKSIFSTPDWDALAAKGAQAQRVLWASTGTKNPKYSDVVYIEELIGRDTVNTAPPATLAAFRDHGRIRDSLTEDVPGARATIEALSLAGISMDAVTQRLLDEGQQLFLDAFRKMLAVLDRARQSSARMAASP